MPITYRSHPDILACSNGNGSSQCLVGFLSRGVLKSRVFRRRWSEDLLGYISTLRSHGTMNIIRARGGRPSGVVDICNLAVAMLLRRCCTQ